MEGAEKEISIDWDEAEFAERRFGSFARLSKENLSASTVMG